MAQLSKFLTLHALAGTTSIERGVLERMLARNLITPDAELRFGSAYVPLFLETSAPKIMLRRSAVVFRHGQLPDRSHKVELPSLSAPL